MFLLNIFPKVKGEIGLVKAANKFKMDIAFSKEEKENLGLKIEDDRVWWKTEYDVPKEINVPDPIGAIIRKVLAKLDTQKQLTEDHLSLWGKFFEETD